MVSAINVETLGGLAVSADGEPLLASGERPGKPWQLFCYLALHRPQTHAPARIMEALWPGQPPDDTSALEDAAGALRRAFKCEEKPDECPILLLDGGYGCNPAIRFDLDVDALLEKARQARQLSGEEQAARLLEVMELYKGEFLPRLDGESWVRGLSLQYRQIFVECSGTLCAYLYEEERYNELLAIATEANTLEPLEEEFYLYIFRALYELKMFRSIISAYSKAARVFSEELGACPGQELQDIYAEAAAQVDSMEQDIMIIKQELQEVALGEPSGGPLYCTYDVFKYLYRMVARASERSGRKVAVILMTLRGKAGGLYPTARVTSQAMNQMKQLILGGILRKSDTVARYSRSQFIMMLSVDKLSSAQQVMNRVRQGSEAFLEPLEMEVAFKNTELEPAG